MAEQQRDEGFLKRLAALFSKSPKTEPLKTTEPKPTQRGLDSIVSWRDLAGWYSDSMSNPANRRAKYKLYQFLDENLAEASTALNVYADTIVSGTVGGEDNYQVYIDEKTPNVDELEKIVKAFEKRTEIKDLVWDFSRDLMSKGDVFEEVVIEQNAEETYIAKFKDLPEEEMYVDVDERGVLRNSDKPYYQLPTAAGLEKRTDFEWWRCVHFKLGRKIYGVDRSIFANASKRIGRQLIMIDDALVLARLARAPMRYVFMVNVKGIPPADRLAYVQKFMDGIKKKQVVDRSSGKINILDAPWAPDDDIGIPVEEGVQQDVKALSGDPNIGNIADVHYFRDKFFGVLTIPKAYASVEEGTRSKATLTQLDVQFARQVRRKQSAMLPGLRKQYEIEFWLHGVDPSSFEWTIEFPELATSDELLKWETMRAKVDVARVLIVDIGAVNTDWVLYEVLGFDQDEIKKYKAVYQAPPTQQDFEVPGSEVPTPGAAPSGPEGQPSGVAGTVAPNEVFISPDLRKRLLRDPFLRQCLEDLRDIVQTKLDREKRIVGKKPVGIKRVEPLFEKWK